MWIDDLTFAFLMVAGVVFVGAVTAWVMDRTYR